MRIEEPPTILAGLTALADATRARLLLVLERHELSVIRLYEAPTASGTPKTKRDNGSAAPRSDTADGVATGAASLD